MNKKLLIQSSTAKKNPGSRKRKGVSKKKYSLNGNNENGTPNTKKQDAMNKKSTSVTKKQDAKSEKTTPVTKKQDAKSEKTTPVTRKQDDVTEKREKITPAVTKKQESLTDKETPIQQNRILLATSIAPFNIEIQRMAIDTWIRAGFDVVSLNSKDEVGLIEQYFSDIKFSIVERTAKEKFGKPYIYIYDFITYLLSTDYQVFGIINSDIHFREVENDFLNFIYKNANSALVYGHRVDIKNFGDAEGKVSKGVDYFFFDKSIASVYEDDGLCMGQPAWDWWMVCVPASYHRSVKRVLSKIAYHQKHPKRWYESLNQYLIESIVLDKYLKNVYPNLTQMELNAEMHAIVLSEKGISYGNNSTIELEER